jgi:hypothetical protein
LATFHLWSYAEHVFDVKRRRVGCVSLHSFDHGRDGSHIRNDQMRATGTWPGPETRPMEFNRPSLHPDGIFRSWD